VKVRNALGTVLPSGEPTRPPGLVVRLGGPRAAAPTTGSTATYTAAAAQRRVQGKAADMALAGLGPDWSGRLGAALALLNEQERYSGRAKGGSLWDASLVEVSSELGPTTNRKPARPASNPAGARWEVQPVKAGRKAGGRAVL